MDALEFLRERRRMCKSFGGYCDGCPLNGKPCTITAGLDDGDCKRIVASVEQWSKEHPRKTRQTEILKMFPEAHVSANGSLYLCPASVSAAYRDKNGNCKVRGLKCADCRKEFWGQEVE